MLSRFCSTVFYVSVNFMGQNKINKLILHFFENVAGYLYGK